MITVDVIVALITNWLPVISAVSGIVVVFVKMIAALKDMKKSNTDELYMVNKRLDSIAQENVSLKRELKKCMIALTKVDTKED